MVWTVKIRESAQRDLERLDASIQRRIFRFLEERIARSEAPQRLGKPLSGRSAGLWRYRVGDYRVICQLDHGQVLVLVVAAGHRRDIYKRLRNWV